MPFITQGKTNWKFLLIVIILAIIVGEGARWYAKRPEKPYQPIEVKKPEIANWETYQWNNLELKHLSNWTVEKTYYQTPAQQANGEPPVNIGLAIFPGTKSTGNDFIAIGGYQVSCDSSENHTKCQFVSSISDFIYTDSNNPDILKVFDQMIPTLKLVKDETANWKTYMNEDEKIGVMYPREWQEISYPIAKEKGLFFVGFSSDVTETNMEAYNAGEILPLVEITKIDRNPKQDIRDLFKNSAQEDKPQSSEIVTIDGIESMKAFQIRYYKIVIFIPKDNYYYQVSLIGTDSTYEPIFNQMLSTFKFLE